MINKSVINEEAVVSEFICDNSDKMMDGVWYPHKKYPSLVISRSADGTYRFAITSDVSISTMPTTYDPYDIVALMEGKIKPGSMEDVFIEYLNEIKNLCMNK